MKFVAVFFSFVVLVSALQQDKFKLTEESRVKVKKVAESCANEHNVDSEMFPRLADGTLPRDEASNKYLYCFALKTGLVDETGHIAVEKLASLVGNHPRAEEFKAALWKCNETTGENLVATVVQMNICYANTSPILLVFQ